MKERDEVKIARDEVRIIRDEVKIVNDEVRIAYDKVRIAKNEVRIAKNDDTTIVNLCYNLVAQQKTLKRDFISVIEMSFNIYKNEIIHVAFSLFKYFSSFKFSKVNFFRHIEKNFYDFFRFVELKLLDLTENEFRNMLRIINFSHKNCYINTRNAVTYRITIN